MSTLFTSLLSLRWFTLCDGAPAAERRHDLHYPLSPMPRVSVLGWHFAAARNLRCLPQWNARQLEAARPEALAASPADLLLVAALRREGALRLPDLQYPLVAVTGLEESPLTDSQLDELYWHFGLPVHQQIRDEAGRLLAYDCLAGNGFHTAVGTVRLEGMIPAEMACACGDPAPKLRPAGRARAAGGIL